MPITPKTGSLFHADSHQFSFGAAPREGDRRRQLDSVVTSICRRGWDVPTQQRAALQLNDDRLLIDDDLLDELANELCSFPR